MKKILMALFLLLGFICTYSAENSGVDAKIEKYNEYKKLVAENREKEIQKIYPLHKRCKSIMHRKN